MDRCRRRTSPQRLKFTTSRQVAGNRTQRIRLPPPITTSRFRQRSTAQQVSPYLLPLTGSLISGRGRPPLQQPPFPNRGAEALLPTITIPEALCLSVWLRRLHRRQLIRFCGQTRLILRFPQEAGEVVRPSPPQTTSGCKSAPQPCP